jgi:uncharacterized membrane protein required for colicin V production
MEFNIPGRENPTYLSSINAILTDQFQFKENCWKFAMILKYNYEHTQIVVYIAVQITDHVLCSCFSAVQNVQTVHQNMFATNWLLCTTALYTYNLLTASMPNLLIVP